MSTSSPSPSEFHILLIDDSVTDARIIERALREGAVPHRLTTIQDGRSALDFLIRLKDPSTPATLEPDLILLDLNLPGLDGFQILAAIKGDDDLRGIPVVVLSTTGRAEDIRQTYRAGANTFIRKPDEYPRYLDLVLVLRQYWSDTAQPHRRRGV